MRNPYDVLGVSRTATDKEIKKAYKKLARKYHPDVSDSPTAGDKFKEVNAAWEILGDENKRRQYDQFGPAAFTGGAQRGPHPGRSGFSGFPGFDFNAGGSSADMDDLLGSIFGMGGRPGGPRKGRDVTVELKLDALISFTGGSVNVQVPRHGGHADRLSIKVPAGVKQGGTLKLSGQGQPARRGGPCGDLHVRLSITDHPLLRRRGDHLEMDVPITISEAIEGAKIVVPTPSGEVNVVVPPGSTTGTKLRLRGRGVQRKNKPGDLYLILRPTIPQSEAAEVIEAARVVSNAHIADVRDDLKI